MTRARVLRSLRSRESALAGQFGPAARTPEHREGVWGSSVSGGLGDVAREARAGQWGADAPPWARPTATVLGAALPLPVWVCFARGSFWPGLEQRRDVDATVLVSDPARPFSSDFTFLVLGRGTFLGILFVPQPWAILD